MRAYEILFESDNRSKIQKLRDVIDHPATEATVRSVAQSKLKLLLDNEPAPPAVASQLVVATNITEEDLDRPYFTGVPVRNIYESLCALQPAPVEISFLRQGQVNMMVPPPFMGLTRQQYYERIQQAVPAVRRIDCRMFEGRGYFFTLSFF